MRDSMKRAMYVGIGVAFMTGEKFKGMASHLAELGKGAEKEGRELYTGFVNRSEAAGKEARQHFDAGVRGAADRMHLATNDAVARLEQRIEELRTELEILRKEREQS